jgi:hypothetical protein
VSESRNCALKSINKGPKRDSYGPAERPQFDDVHSSLTAFAFANERLRFAELRG